MHLNDIHKTIRWPIGTLIFYGIFRDVIDRQLSLPLWNSLALKEDTWLDFSTGLASFVLASFGWKSYHRDYTPNHIGIFISIALLIFLFYFDGLSCYYILFCGKIPCWFMLIGAYALGVLGHKLIVQLINRCRGRREDGVQNTNISLLKDIPIGNIRNDEMAFEPIAERIEASIVGNDVETAFSIGIIGPWGAGKTTLLNFVKELLSKRTDVIVIEFSPIQSASVQDIQKDFLSRLGESLARYHSGAKKVTRNYMTAIGVLPDSLWAFKLIGVLGAQDLTARRDEITKVIHIVGKKLVILIDDFDRLTSEEIHEVLKLIDKNASFPNTFFITAYDKTVTDKVISSHVGIAPSESVRYTDKYFNLEISLPIRKQGRYINVLNNSLCSLIDLKTIGCSKEAIEQALPRLYPFIPEYLPTLRDVKRYINIVAISLPPVEKDVLIGDFLLLTLIRYKFPDEYVRLAKREFITYRNVISASRDMTLILKSDALKGVDCSDVLMALFPSKQASYKSLAHDSSFEHYFYDIDSEDLSYQNMSRLLKPDITIDQFKGIINSWMSNERKMTDVTEFILSREDGIKNIEDTKAYFRLFLTARTCCNARELYVATISYILKANLSTNARTFKFPSTESYAGFLKDVLNNLFDFRLSIESIHDALHAANIIDSEQAPDFVFSSEELMSFALGKVDNALSLVPSGDIVINDIYRAMRACVIEYIPDYNGGETVDKSAIEKVKSAILKYPDYFFSSALKHFAESGRSAIQLHLDKEVVPYKELFKNCEEFKKIVDRATFESHIVGNCMAQFAEYCVAQKSWTPVLPVSGEISVIKQGDYDTYNKLFEGEPVEA